jgi:ribonucleoside-diphosphate reductase alpha chain
LKDNSRKLEFPVKKVIKRDGRVVDFDPTRIREAIRKAMVHVNRYDEESLNKVVEYVLKIIAEKYGAEKIPHVEEIQDIVELSLVKFDLYEVAKAYILYRKERERIREEKKRILEKDHVDEVDKAFSLNALRLMASRYLLRDESGRLRETPKQMFQRVAALIVIPDILHDPRIFDRDFGQKEHPQEDFDPARYEGRLGLGRRQDGSFEVTWNRWHLERMKYLYDELNRERAMKVSWSEFLKMLEAGEFEGYYENFLQYYQLMVSKRFMPNSPTLFNAGTRLGQLSACFVLHIDDNLESIMDAAKHAALIFKSGGGVGINYSRLRPEGDIVFSTFGVASGPVSFMRIIDTVTDVVKQGGKRRGANMGILEIWHPDIETFIKAKEREGFLENFNISILITPDFWEHYEQGKPYPLRNPRDGKIWRTIDPARLLRTIAEMAWKTGDPGVLFQDNMNKHNIFLEELGPIRSTNPCISGDARVPTTHGLIKLSELYELYKSGEDIEILTDDRVLLNTITFYGGRCTQLMASILRSPSGSLRKPLRVLKSGIKNVYEIVTSHGYKVKATADHKILTDRGWVEVKDLRKGDKVFIQPSGCFGKYGSIELGRILGWLIGDGQLDKNGRVRLWFYGEDKHLAEMLARDIRVVLGKPVRVNNARDRNACYIVSRRLGKLLVEVLGVRDMLGVPEIVFKGNKEMQRGFLQALFTADGTLLIGNGECSVRLTSISKKLLEDVQLLLLNFGIVSRIYENRRRAQARLLPDGKEGYKKYWCESYHELSIDKENGDGFAEQIGFLDERRQNKLMEWIRSKKRRSNRELFTTTVESVKYVGEEEVYDIVEPVTKSFIANGICVHNCGEQPLYPFESCNLGSVNVYAFVRHGESGPYFDWDGLAETVRLAVRFLDNVIDVNKYPLKQIEYRTKRSRRIGLGVMGVADALFALRIPYNSEEGFRFMSRLAEFIAYHAYLASVELAKERGPFPLYWDSAYPKGELPIEGFYHPEEWTLNWNKLVEEIKKHGIRNSHVTTVAPTGSISMLVDVSSGLEPQFALVYEKRVTVGTFYYVDIEFERQLKERGLLNDVILKKVAENGGSVQGIEEIPEDMRRVFLVAYDIPWWDHVRAQYEFQKWVDASVSKTINMPAWVTVDDVLKAYLFAYKLGLKGITIYRDTSKSAQVLVTPTQRLSRYIALTPNKTLEFMRSLGIEPPAISVQEIEDVERKKRILQVAYAGGEHAEIEVEKAVSSKSVKKEPYERCPECGSPNLIYQEGCVKCVDCGWTSCLVT